MGIEDIPELLLAEASYAFVPYNVNKKFDGKFIVLQREDNQNYIFARNGFGEHKEMVDCFMRVVKGNYGIEDPQNLFKVINGGLLSIRGGKVTLEDKSELFGKYEEKVVRPIVEKWTRENLPNNICAFL